MNRRKFITGAGALVASAVAPPIPFATNTETIQLLVSDAWALKSDAEIIADLYRGLISAFQIPLDRLPNITVSRAITLLEEYDLAHPNVLQLEPIRRGGAAR